MYTQPTISKPEDTGIIPSFFRLNYGMESI